MIPLPIIVLFFNGPSKVKAFAMGFVATTLISGPVALFVIGISVSDLLLDPSLRSLGIIRLSIINYHWFSYSQVIAIILLLVISLYQKKLIIRIFCYLGVLVCGYFLLLIGSRQSIGAGVISIIILLILSMKFSTKKILPAFLLILCILGFGYYFLNNNLDLVLRPARGEEGLFDIFQLVKERGPYWEQGVRQFLQNPIFGAGYASDTNAHNLFIGVLADQGLVGMFFLFGFIFFFIQQGLRIRFRGDKQKFFWSIGILSIGIFGFIHGQASGTPISLWHVWWSAAMVWILNSNFHTLNGKTNLIVSNNEQA
jgi:O-antigen ligase